MQEFAAAIASGTQAGYIELVHYRLCGILLFQDVLFVPGAVGAGIVEPTGADLHAVQA